MLKARREHPGEKNYFNNIIVPRCEVCLLWSFSTQSTMNLTWVAFSFKGKSESEKLKWWRSKIKWNESCWLLNANCWPEPVQKKWELKPGLSLLGQYGKPWLPEQEGLPTCKHAPNLLQGAGQAGQQGLARGRREREWELQARGTEGELNVAPHFVVTDLGKFKIEKNTNGMLSPPPVSAF